MDIIAYSQQIINQESYAVQALAGFIQPDFDKMIRTLADNKGRCIVSGIGKSAHIAQKMVATLNSTGTPSYFLHAAEAVHGDLGLVHQDDIVLIISKSGESPEILNLVYAIQKMGNKIIGMVGNTQSTLAKAAHWVINTSVEREACPLNLAPTSSTTCQLVMADVVAICLMTLKKFTKENFALYHPGGALGKKLLKTNQEIIQHHLSPYVGLDTPFSDVITDISKGRLGATVVLDEHRQIVGIITDGDIRRLMKDAAHANTLKAQLMMNPNPKKVINTHLASLSLDIMNQHNINQLIVVDDHNAYKGIIHMHDILKEGIHA